MADPGVGPFLFHSQWVPERDETICFILEASQDPAHTDNGQQPAYLVRFEDGHRRVVRATALHPWFWL